MAHVFKSLIQGSFGGQHKNFEAVVLEGRELWHWWRDNSAPGNPWKRGQKIIADRAAFAGSIIQSNFGSGGNGNFEVVVPLLAPNGDFELWHMWHDNSDVNKPWSFGQRITEQGRRVVGPASVIQSNFGSGGHGNFEVAVPVIDDSGHAELRHYWHDNSDVKKPWSKGQRINSPQHQVLGGGCLIQSNFGSGGHGNFEVAAWVRLADGRSVLQHYWHDNSDVNLPWRSGQIIVERAKGAGVMIQSSFGSPHGNFEVVVAVEGPFGRTYLQHVLHDNSNVNLPWRPGQTISEVMSTNGGACLIESDYRSGAHGNFEVLVDECSQSLVAYWHPNRDVNLPWIRHALLLGEPPGKEIRDTQRVCQLTGEFDRTGWGGAGQPPLAFNRTESRFGVRGTDLGVSFEHKNRIYFLFGDTWRSGESQSAHFDWDSIAFCTDTTVSGGLSLTFYKQPPMVPGINQGAFEVPLDGFSLGAEMFVFFSTDHTQEGDAALMGRSVLAVSVNDGYDFTPLLTFSRQKFINVTVEHARLDKEQAVAVGWPTGTDVLWIWGSGRYRGSPAYLAVVDLGEMQKRVRSRHGDGIPDLVSISDEKGPVRYYSGGPESVTWSQHEWQAVPLFCAGDIGELSCRRNSVFDRFFMTYNTGNPRGITLRHSAQPWGPWSSGIVIFDPGWGSGPGQPIGAGFGRFMHIDWRVAKVDHVQDDAFFSGIRDNEFAGEYGPYQITRFSTGVHKVSGELFYTMSTWNPYQSMLMRTHINAADLVG